MIKNKRNMGWICQICKTEIFVDTNMVMLKDDLWLSIANEEDVLCPDCIEEKLKRKISNDDLKRMDRKISERGVKFVKEYNPNIPDVSESELIPVNIFYAYNNNLTYI